MGQFKDKQDRTWVVDATVLTLRRVKNDLDIDLTDPLVITTLGEDIFVFGSVIYSLCETQVLQRGISEDDFAAAFDGDTLEAAALCLIEALIAFTRPVNRRALRLAWQKREEMLAKTAEAQIKMTEGPLMDQALENEFKKTEAELRERFGTPSTTLPESSESTPTP